MLDRSRSFRLGRAMLVFVASAAGSLDGAAQQSPCDSTLQAKARGPLGYALRGDRCEGMYVQQVAGTPLWVASLTGWFEAYEPDSGADLLVEWAGPDTGTIRLQAQGIRHDLYYRMDAARPAASRSFRWPTDLLAAQRIRREDIGVLGRTTLLVGGAETEVYVPLRITQRSLPSETASYELLLLPAMELSEVYLSLALVSADGRTLSELQVGKPLRYGSYQPDTPVAVTLPSLPRAGLYRVEVGADLARGGSTTVTFWVYHGAAPRAR